MQIEACIRLFFGYCFLVLTLLASEVILNPYNIILIGRLNCICVLPDLCNHSPAIEADKSVALTLVKTDDLTY
jgi:hypothetical protein